MVIYFIEYWYLIDRENKSKSCESFFNISNEITKFVTMEIDEEGLYKNIKLAKSARGWLHPPQRHLGVRNFPEPSFVHKYKVWLFFR